MEGVVALINRLQSAATTLGDNAGSDKSLPSLWSLLPSIVVIGGQVRLCLVDEKITWNCEPDKELQLEWNFVTRCVKQPPS